MTFYIVVFIDYFKFELASVPYATPKWPISYYVSL